MNHKHTNCVNCGDPRGWCYPESNSWNTCPRKLLYTAYIVSNGMNTDVIDYIKIYHGLPDKHFLLNEYTNHFSKKDIKNVRGHFNLNNREMNEVFKIMYDNHIEDHDLI